MRHEGVWEGLVEVLPPTPLFPPPSAFPGEEEAEVEGVLLPVVHLDTLPPFGEKLMEGVWLGEGVRERVREGVPVGEGVLPPPPTPFPEVVVTLGEREAEMEGREVCVSKVERVEEGVGEVDSVTPALGLLDEVGVVVREVRDVVETVRLGGLGVGVPSTGEVEAEREGEGVVLWETVEVVEREGREDREATLTEGDEVREGLGEEV